jgi:hypothetical protein
MLGNVGFFVALNGPNQKTALATPPIKVSHSSLRRELRFGEEGEFIGQRAALGGY